MPAGMSNSQINRLGKRLRETDTVSSYDLALLQQLREAHDDALAEVARILRDELRLEPTTRLKTVNTLVDKVRREHMKLAEVQDIAGARITLDESETRTQQDAWVARLEERFPGCKVIDRRLKPTFGYRAVHLVVRTLDCRVEIQVRTQYQHVWAQLVESVADSWGRQIRYGGQPEAPDRAGPAGVTRREAWADALEIAEVFDELEQRNVKRAALEGGSIGCGPRQRPTPRRPLCHCCKASLSTWRWTSQCFAGVGRSFTSEWSTSSAGWVMPWRLTTLWPGVTSG